MLPLPGFIITAWVLSSVGLVAFAETNPSIFSPQEIDHVIANYMVANPGDHKIFEFASLVKTLKRANETYDLAENAALRDQGNMIEVPLDLTRQEFLAQVADIH